MLTTSAVDRSLSESQTALADFTAVANSRLTYSIEISMPDEYSLGHLDMVDPLLTKARALMQNEQYLVAVGNCNTILRVTPNHAHALSLRAFAYSKLKVHKRAVRDAEPLVKLQPRLADAWLCLGDINFATNNFMMSLEAWRSGSKLGDSSGSDGCKRKIQELQDIRVREEALLGYLSDKEYRKSLPFMERMKLRWTEPLSDLRSDLATEWAIEERLAKLGIT